MYKFQVLASATGATPADLAESVSRAISERGRWEQFVELRMGAGPTVAIEPIETPEPAVRASVNWGSQAAHADVSTVEAAIEAVDRLAHAFYEMRKQQAVL
jgi:hypothetical protein